MIKNTAKESKFFRVAISFVLSIIPAFILAVDTNTCMIGPDTDSCPGVTEGMLRFAIIFGATTIVLFLFFNWWGKRIGVWKLIVTLITLIAVFAFTYSFVAHPHKVSGGNVSIYKNNQVVFGVAKWLIPFREISIGDIVIVKGTATYRKDLIGKVVGVQGDEIKGEVYSQLDELTQESKVPNGFYLFSVGDSEKVRLVSGGQITELIWLGL